MSSTKLNIPFKELIQFIAVVIAIVVVNILTNNFYFRLDLTAENRYSLKPVTKDILHKIDDYMYVDIYLDGDIPADFKKMKQAIKEQLAEYKVYAGSKLQYKFINPSAEKDANKRNMFYNDLFKRGLVPVNMQAEDDEGGTSEKIIFPGAVVRYKNNEMAINLLRSNRNISPEENLNISIEGLEYEFVMAFHNLMKQEVEKIAFLEGHDELNEHQTGDLTREIAKFYQVDRGVISTVNCLKDYKAVIIAKPQTPFTEKEKFTLDQYIMNGGKVMWFIDPIAINIDSLAYGSAFTYFNDVNLTDMLFYYGVRVNPELVKDMNCNVIPLSTGSVAGQTQFTPAPWLYEPLMVPPPNNAITKGIDLVWCSYTGYLDTLPSPTIRKTVLLSSSNASYAVKLPLFIELQEVKSHIDPRRFNQPNLPVSVMLSGKFNSAYKNRGVGQYIDAEGFQFKSQSDENKMVVFADGDIIRNQVKMSAQGPLISPLGFDRYSQQTFGNKAFVMNVFHALMGNEELISLRVKEFKIRILNREKVKSNKQQYQVINVVLPIVFFILMGWGMNYYRKRRFTK